LQYKSDVVLFCRDDLKDELWKNVTFYKVKSNIDYSSFNKTSNYTASIPFQKINIDNKKYFFEPSKNMLIIKRLLRNDIEQAYFCNSTSSNKSIAFYPQSNLKFKNYI
jgi:hypothetical protein